KKLCEMIDALERATTPEEYQRIADEVQKPLSKHRVPAHLRDPYIRLYGLCTSLARYPLAQYPHTMTPEHVAAHMKLIQAGLADALRIAEREEQGGETPSLTTPRISE